MTTARLRKVMPTSIGTSANAEIKRTLHLTQTKTMTASAMFAIMQCAMLKIRAIACPDFRFFSLSSAYLYAEIVIIKNNTNSEFTSVFVLFPCGGEKGIRTLAPVS